MLSAAARFVGVSGGSSHVRHRGSIEEIFGKLKDTLEATKWMWDNKRGTHVKTDIPDWSVRIRAITEIRHWLAMDKAVKEEVSLGKKEKPMQLDLPTVNASIQEWEDWAQGREAGVLAERTQAAEEMKLIAEGQRILREEGSEKAGAMMQAALDARARQGRRMTPP